MITNGLYHEGFVNDLESVLSQHRMSTVMTYGMQKSRKCRNDREDKENEEVAQVSIKKWLQCRCVLVVKTVNWG